MKLLYLLSLWRCPFPRLTVAVSHRELNIFEHTKDKTIKKLNDRLCAHYKCCSIPYKQWTLRSSTFLRRWVRMGKLSIFPALTKKPLFLFGSTTPIGTIQRSGCNPRFPPLPTRKGVPDLPWQRIS